MDAIREGAGYTAVHLKEMHDEAPRRGQSPNLEDRPARGPLSLRRSGLSYVRLAPGLRAPLHVEHAAREAIYVVVTGTVCATVGEDAVELNAFDALRVDPAAIHALEAGANGAELLVFTCD
jgi:mannose-6-phosphate isomerase-like protein (cupin superfamily)